MGEQWPGLDQSGSGPLPPTLGMAPVTPFRVNQTCVLGAYTVTPHSFATFCANGLGETDTLDRRGRSAKPLKEHGRSLKSGGKGADKGFR